MARLATSRPRVPRIGLTGGIACGKSLFLRELEARGFATLDADDIVHELVPAEERRRLAARVFADAGARRALEARIHPVVRARIAAWFAGGEDSCARGGAGPRVAAVPLLYEAGWEDDFDVVACVVSSHSAQIERLVSKRGMTHAEAESRMAAQLDPAEKAARSDWPVSNDGSPEELSARADEFVRWVAAGCPPRKIEKT